MGSSRSVPSVRAPDPTGNNALETAKHPRLRVLVRRYLDFPVDSNDFSNHRNYLLVIPLHSFSRILGGQF